MVVIIAIIVLLPAAGIACFFIFPIFLAIIVTIVASYFAYHLFKYILNIIRSKIETNEESIQFVLGKNDATEMAWDEIDFAGYCTQRRGRPFLYVYQEQEDKLLTVPNEYEGFANLVDEMRKKTALEDVALSETETINDYLKEKLEVQENGDNQLDDHTTD